MQTQTTTFNINNGNIKNIIARLHKSIIETSKEPHNNYDFLLSIASLSMMLKVLYENDLTNEKINISDKDFFIYKLRNALSHPTKTEKSSEEESVKIDIDDIMGDNQTIFITMENIINISKQINSHSNCKLEIKNNPPVPNIEELTDEIIKKAKAECQSILAKTKNEYEKIIKECETKILELKSPQKAKKIYGEKGTSQKINGKKK